MLKRILLCSFLFIPVILQAATGFNDISMTASVNKTALTMEDELTLTVRVEGATGELFPQLPSLPAFNVYARSTATQITNFHAVTTFDFVMMPRFPGKAEIPPITLNYRGKTYKTDPITVTIYRTGQQKSAAAPSANKGQKAPSAYPIQEAPSDMPALERKLYNLAARQGDKNYFMVAAASETDPYVNQTFTFGVRFYYLLPFVGNAPYTAPSIDNLFLEEIGRPEGTQIINGKRYTYTEIRYALTGVTAGPAKVGPASIDYVPGNRMDLSVFDRVFATATQAPQQAQSNSVTLNIRPVPTKNRPKTFYGAVGSGYSISAALDRSEVEAGEAVNLTVKVNGSGNLKPTADLKIPPITGFKIYDVVSSSGVVSSNGDLKSYKIFKTVIVPSASGSYVIPALYWSYFDPVKQQYLTIRTEPLPLKVTPSSHADTGFDFSTHTDLNQGFRQLEQDIRYLKSNLADTQISFLTKIARLNLLTYLLLALLILAALFSLAGKKAFSSKKALVTAKNALKNAHSEEAVADALSHYLFEKYAVHTASLPLRDIVAALKVRSCPIDLIQRFETLWQRLDAARFAPVAMQTGGTYELAKQALDLVQDMDKGEIK